MISVVVTSRLIMTIDRLALALFDGEPVSVWVGGRFGGASDKALRQNRRITDIQYAVYPF
jgi:hypothetical protein